MVVDSDELSWIFALEDLSRSYRFLRGPEDKTRLHQAGSVDIWIMDDPPSPVQASCREEALGSCHEEASPTIRAIPPSDAGNGHNPRLFLPSANPLRPASLEGRWQGSRLIVAFTGSCSSRIQSRQSFHDWVRRCKGRKRCGRAQMQKHDGVVRATPPRPRITAMLSVAAGYYPAAGQCWRLTALNQTPSDAPETATALTQSSPDAVLLLLLPRI